MSTLLGERLRILRKSKHMTQDALVEALNSQFNININKSMISKWENNKSDPYLEYVKYIAVFFSVSLDYLIGLSDTAESVRPDQGEAQLANIYGRCSNFNKGKLLGYAEQLLSSQVGSAATEDDVEEVRALFGTPTKQTNKL